MIVVVIGGGPILPGSWRNSVPALLLAWYPGMEGGNALADVLSGAAEPGGRLPVAIATDQAHLPPFENDAPHVVYDGWWGQRQLDRDGHVAAYPFGFGLGYTSFALSELTVAVAPGRAAAGHGVGWITARVTATNVGDRDGATVVQLYGVADHASIDSRPPRQLLGFTRVEVPAGAGARIELQGSLRPLARRDSATGRWSLPDGVYVIEAAGFWGDPAAARKRVSSSAAGNGRASR